MPRWSPLPPTRAADGGGRERSRLSDSVSSLPSPPTRNFSLPDPLLIRLLYFSPFTLCAGRKVKASKKSLTQCFFFFTSLSLYLLRLLPLHYHFLIFFMHCPRGIFSLLPSPGCSFSNFCSAPGVAGVWVSSTLRYAAILRNKSEFCRLGRKSPACQPDLLSSLLYFKLRSFLSVQIPLLDW